MEDNHPGDKTVISLPKGGGAIKGIGETFQPDLFTGTGNFAVPIYTSPGRGGFGPNLTLQYSSGSGNGPFGLGWSLSNSRVTRKTEKGLPTYTDKDVFVMSGAEDLVPVLDENGNPVNVPDLAGYTITRYRPRTEGLFARIDCWQHSDEPNDVHWRATTKENVTSIYGKSPSARLVDPDQPDHIFEWLLEETFDAKGNHILYEYVQEDPDLTLPGIHERNRRYTQAYPRRVLYGNTSDTIDPDKKVGPERTASHHLDPTRTKSRHYLFEVLFDYGDLPNPLPVYEESSTDPAWWDRNNDNFSGVESRQDPFSTYRSGFEIRTLRLCHRILMLHHFKEGELIGAPLVKSTNFIYNQDPSAGFSMLRSVTVWGHRKDPQDATTYLSRDLPPVTFGYSEFEPERQRYQSVIAEEGDFPPRALNDPSTTLMDIFGDGITDIVQSTPEGFYYWENLGNARLGRRHHPEYDVPAGVSLDQPNVAIADLGGDGLPDLMVEDRFISGIYEATPDGGWKPFKRIQPMPTFNFSDPNVRLVDLIGDGLSDVLITRDSHFLWYRSMGEDGFDEQPRVIRQHDLDTFPDVYFSDPAGRVRLADMTGDGLNDIVLVHDGRIDYWPNLGYCRWGKRVTMGDTPHIGYSFDPRRIFLADLDGTGCADLVYVDFDQVHFWFNRSGNSWSEKHIILGTPHTVDTIGLQFADFYATGTTCLIWSYDYGSITGGNYKVLDFCGTKKPHLLVEMSNNMGATTRAQYASSTKFYLEDKKNGTSWVTNLPFPVQVLEKTEAIDHISKTKLVTTYKYHHGYYDGREREFRGFGRVDQYDTEIFETFSKSSLHEGEELFTNNQKSYHVPPVLTKNWFHTGVYFDENLPSSSGVFYDERDMMAAYREEFYQEDDQAFLLDDHDLDPSDSPHEAHRALRGSLIRSETYSLDGTDRARHSYTVTENRYRVKQLQPKGENNHAVFLTLNKESLSYHYERNPNDPRITHQLNLKYDDYGNPRESVAISYPRRIPLNDDEGNPFQEQANTKAVYTFSQFINKDGQAGHYYIGLPCETKTFEVHGLDFSWPGDGDKGVVKPLNDAVFDAVKDKNEYEPFDYQPPEGLIGLKKRIIEWTRQYYRMDADPGHVDPIGDLSHRLTFGKIESLALPYESYQAAVSRGFINNLLPIHLSDSDLQNQGGYHRETLAEPEPSSDSEFTKIWWIPSGRQSFSEQKFYLSEKVQDPFGNVLNITFDDYCLLANSSEDAVGNVITADNDYRVLQPHQVTDPNANISQVKFDALGLVVGTAVMGEGKNGDPLGDNLDNFVPDSSQEDIDQHIKDPINDPHALLQNATSRLVYDLHRYIRNGQPIVVYILAREKHVSEENGAHSKIQHSFVYSDGFGREVQTKIQAEPGEVNGITAPNRWVGTGTKIFNNKGKQVQQFEPFFSDTHEYGIEQHGVSPIHFYDPLERVVCTLYPNHTYEKVVFDAWRQETWDVNDTVAQEDPSNDSHVGVFFAELDMAEYMPTWYTQRKEGALGADEAEAADKTFAHADTTTVAYLDTLGRVFLTEEDDGTPEKVWTHVLLDIEGFEMTITDPRGIRAFAHRFDMAGRKLQVDSVDAGIRKTMLDVNNQPIFEWDANGNEVFTSYDALRRPIDIWVKKWKTSSYYLAQKIIYGETAPAAIVGNHRGQIWRVYDGAGLVENTAYDFKGNLMRIRRTLLTDGLITEPTWARSDDPVRKPIFNATAARRQLNTNHRYVVTTDYDALNRVTRNEAPDGTIQEPYYKEANLLDRLSVTHAGSTEYFVVDVAYNARGQRTCIDYGNGVTINYEYDPFTFRLTRIASYRQGGSVDDPDLQDLEYTYDPMGNITCIRDDAHQVIFNHNNRIEPASSYRYDPLYRLVEASGREHENMTPCHYRQGHKKQSELITLTNQPITDGQALGNYTEIYTYDKGGNIELFQHNNRTTNQGWSREQRYEEDSNRLRTSRASPGCSYDRNLIHHDANGNIERLSHLPDMRWDYRNQLVAVQLNHANRSDNANWAYYQYDSGGQRVRKTVVKGGTTEERIYIGDYEVFRRSRGKGEGRGKERFRRETIHIMDDKERIALIETQRLDNNSNKRSPVERVRYQLTNHLGSAILEVASSQAAQIVSYEEYYPFGGTAYIAGQNETEAKRRRYRYSGKERDDETGLYYYGARYYGPWLGRWCSTDPAGFVDGMNLYVFVNGNPIAYGDVHGLSKESKSKETKSEASKSYEFTNIPWEKLRINYGLPDRPEFKYKSTKEETFADSEQRKYREYYEWRKATRSGIIDKLKKRPDWLTSTEKIEEILGKFKKGDLSERIQKYEQIDKDITVTKEEINRLKEFSIADFRRILGKLSEDKEWDNFMIAISGEAERENWVERRGDEFSRDKGIELLYLLHWEPEKVYQFITSNTSEGGILLYEFMKFEKMDNSPRVNYQKQKAIFKFFYKFWEYKLLIKPTKEKHDVNMISGKE